MRLLSHKSLGSFFCALKKIKNNGVILSEAQRSRPDHWGRWASQRWQIVWYKQRRGWF